MNHHVLNKNTCHLGVYQRRTWWKNQWNLWNIHRKPEGIIHWFSEVFGGIILYSYGTPMIFQWFPIIGEPPKFAICHILLSHPIALLGKRLPDFGCVFNILYIYIHVTVLLMFEEWMLEWPWFPSQASKCSSILWWPSPGFSLSLIAIANLNLLLLVTAPARLTWRQSLVKFHPGEVSC